MGWEQTGWLKLEEINVSRRSRLILNFITLPKVAKQESVVEEQRPKKGNASPHYVSDLLWLANKVMFISIHGKLFLTKAPLHSIQQAMQEKPSKCSKTSRMNVFYGLTYDSHYSPYILSPVAPPILSVKFWASLTQSRSLSGQKSIWEVSLEFH